MPKLEIIVIIFPIKLSNYKNLSTLYTLYLGKISITVNLDFLIFIPIYLYYKFNLILIKLEKVKLTN